MDERLKTQNGYGWTTDVLNPISTEMLSFVTQTRGLTLLDIGAAYGVATLPALRAGVSVIANDLEANHLNEIIRIASQEGFVERLTTLKGRFPEISQLENLDAIHCSNVLHFLSGDEIRLAFAYARRALSFEGKLFIQVGTPFAGHVRKFLPVYEDRFLREDEWPGEISDTKLFLPAEIRDEVPQFLHLLDRDRLCTALEAEGFRIEHAEYYSRPGLPEVCRNDGRENLGIVAILRAW